MQRGRFFFKKKIQYILLNKKIEKKEYTTHLGLGVTCTITMWIQILFCPSRYGHVATFLLCVPFIHDRSALTKIE